MTKSALAPPSRRRFTTEYVSINGVKHFVLHYEVPGAPVLIYLHGGPGQATSNLAYRTDRDIATHTTVYYDQRGSGKTLMRNLFSTRDVTCEQLLDDLDGVVAHVRARYGVDKVALLGHSWGSLLGTEYVKRHPEKVLCYIGVGQMVNTRAAERAGLAEVARLVDPSNAKDAATLRGLEGYPDGPAFGNEKRRMKALMTLRKLQGKYGIGVDVSTLGRVFIKSPIFTPLDLVAITLAARFNKGLEITDFEYDTTGFTDYRVPMYYVLGRHDWQVPSALAADYFEHITAPRKALHWIEDAGHVPNLENTAAFNEAMAAVLADAVQHAAAS